MANLRKILAIKPFRIPRQIHKGAAPFFVISFSSRPLQFLTMFNHRSRCAPLLGRFSLRRELGMGAGSGMLPEAAFEAGPRLTRLPK